MLITKFTGSPPVRRPSAVNPGENSYKPHMLGNHSSLFIVAVIQSRMANSKSHNVRTSSVSFLKHTFSWSLFKVILIGAGRNP